MGFLEVLTLVFIVLKLLGIITWGWLAVFSPMILAFSLYILALIVFVFISMKSGKSISKSLKRKK